MRVGDHLLAKGTAVATVGSNASVSYALALLAEHDEPVTALMTTDVRTCDPDTTVNELMALMTERRIRHVPVVVDDLLAGIVSIGDAVKHRIGELESETQTMHEYIWHGR